MSFSALKEADFFGRADALSVLASRIEQAIHCRSQSAVLSGPRGIGKTELLKQLFCQLFWGQDRIAPFYYEANPALLSASSFSADYLTRFLCQRIAFQNREQQLLHVDGISLDALSSIAEEREAAWAVAILEQYRKSEADVLSALRIAVRAPQQAALATGTPAAILLDDFHLIHHIRIEDKPDIRLTALFGGPMSFGKTPHILSGNAAELQEMHISAALERILLRPLGPRDCQSAALLKSLPAQGSAAPLRLFEYLGGNPFYLSCVLNGLSAGKNPEEQDYWKACAAAVAGGPVCLRWASALKRFFPALSARRSGLIVAHTVYNAKESLSCGQIAKKLKLPEAQVEAIAQGLYLAGFITGEYGVFGPMDDAVLRDVIDFLYRKELEGKGEHGLEQEILARLLPDPDETVRFEMTLPMSREVELIAAQCLEQIGKNHHVDPDIIGQMQIAVIEACINATEHGKGVDRNLYVAIAIRPDRTEVSVESSGQEFVLQGTGEPFDRRKPSKTDGRGWGIKLMKRFVDEVRFEKTGRGTKTVLVKKTAKKAGAQKESAGDRE